MAAVYVAVAAATMALSSRPLRPLFDGFAPPPPYRWVKPPPEVARDNRRPAAARRDVALGPEGSPFVNVTPDDGQAITVLEGGAVAPKAGDTSALVTVTPLDAGALGPLPAGLEVQGNAYRVAITYQPSGAPVAALARPGSISLVAAGPSDVMLYAPDGRAWERRPTQPLATSHGLQTALTAPGVYLVTSIEDRPAAAAGTPALVYVVVLGLPPLLLVGLAVRRRRAAAGAGAAAATRRPGRGRGGRPSPRPRPGRGRPGRRRR